MREKTCCRIKYNGMMLSVYGVDIDAKTLRIHICFPDGACVEKELDISTSLDPDGILSACIATADKAAISHAQRQLELYKQVGLHVN